MLNSNKIKSFINEPCDITLIVNNSIKNREIKFSYSVLSIEDYEFIMTWLEGEVMGDYKFKALTIN